MQTPFGCLQHPWPFPITRTTCPGASASAPSLFPGTRKDTSSSFSLGFFSSPAPGVERETHWQRESVGQEGGEALSAAEQPFPRSGHFTWYVSQRKASDGGCGMEAGDSPLCYLQANPSSSAWSFLCAFILSPSTTGAVTFPITLVSSSLTSRDWGSPKTGFVCI